MPRRSSSKKFGKTWTKGSRHFRYQYHKNGTRSLQSSSIHGARKWGTHETKTYRHKSYRRR